jgi:hypothetical protein
VLPLVQDESARLFRRTQKSSVVNFVTLNNIQPLSVQAHHSSSKTKLTPFRGRPQENLAHPATWLSLHRATLHYLVSIILRYFRVLHDEPTHRNTLILQAIHNLLDIPPTAPSTPLSGNINSHIDQSLDSPNTRHYPSATLPPSVFDLAVAATVTRLHISSFMIHSIDDPLLVTICKRFYSPLFGHSEEDYWTAVHLSYST